LRRYSNGFGITYIQRITTLPILSYGELLMYSSVTGKHECFE